MSPHELCCRSAYKNKGVQTLLDGVTAYLPSPLDVTNTALDVNKDQAPLTLPSTKQVCRNKDIVLASSSL